MRKNIITLYHWLKRCRGELISIAGIIVASYLTFVQIRVARQLDSSQKTLQKLDGLIDNSANTNRFLSSAVIDLHSQLEFNRKVQDKANYYEDLKMIVYINKLLLANISLGEYNDSLLMVPRQSIKAQNELLKKEKNIVVDQIDNLFLEENPKLFKKWKNCIGGVDMLIKFSVSVNPSANTDWDKIWTKNYYTSLDNVFERINALQYEIMDYCILTNKTWFTIPKPDIPVRPQLGKFDRNHPLFNMINGKEVPVDSMEIEEMNSMRLNGYKEMLKHYRKNYADWLRSIGQPQQVHYYNGFPPL